MLSAGILVWWLDSYIITLYICYGMKQQSGWCQLSHCCMCSHWCGGLCPGAIPYQFSITNVANVRLFIHHDITQAPNSVLTLVQKHSIL